MDRDLSPLRVTFDLKIAVHLRNASDFAPVVGELETSSAELSGEHLPDQQPDDPAPNTFCLPAYLAYAAYVENDMAMRL